MQKHNVSAIRKELSKTKFIAFSAVIALLALLSVVQVPSQAYGQSNWQITFSGNCNNKPICDLYGGGTGGFWGWCALGGGVQSGNNADCESTSYSFFSSPVTCPPFCQGPQHISVSGTSWSNETIPGFGGVFVITSGTIILSGAFIVQAIASGSSPPPSCVVAQSGHSITCDVAIITGGMGFGIVPAIVGHLSDSACFILPTGPIYAPGCHYDQQVAQIS